MLQGSKLQCLGFLQALILIVVQTLAFPAENLPGNEADIQNGQDSTVLESQNGTLDLDENGRIVGGGRARPGEFPYQIFLRIKGVKNRRYECGGSIILPNFILTAAHCLFVPANPEDSKDSTQIPVRPEDLIVQYGIIDNRDTQAVKYVKRYKVHEQYSYRETDYDLALLELCDPIPQYSSEYPASVIPIAPPNYPVQGKALVSGWGATDRKNPNNEKDDDELIMEDDQFALKKVILQYLDRETCMEFYRNYTGIYQKRVNAGASRITERNICTIGERGDSCQGDSGGPMTCFLNNSGSSNNTRVLCGVVSFGYGCAWPGVPGAYVNMQNEEMYRWVNYNARASPGRC